MTRDLTGNIISDGEPDKPNTNRASDRIAMMAQPVELPV
jgi:hypothetical protein